MSKINDMILSDIETISENETISESDSPEVLDEQVILILNKKFQYYL